MQRLFHCSLHILIEESLKEVSLNSSKSPPAESRCYHKFKRWVLKVRYNFLYQRLVWFFTSLFPIQMTVLKTQVHVNRGPYYLQAFPLSSLCNFSLLDLFYKKLNFFEKRFNKSKICTKLLGLFLHKKGSFFPVPVPVFIGQSSEYQSHQKHLSNQIWLWHIPFSWASAAPDAKIQRNPALGLISSLA